MSNLEGEVKALIKESLNKRIQGLGTIDPDLNNAVLIERWLTDIMAIGYNNIDLNKASIDVFEIQKPLEGITGNLVILEDIRGRINLSYMRFGEEVEAFMQFVNLRNSESSEVVLFKVKEELQYVESDSFQIC